MQLLIFAALFLPVILSGLTVYLFKISDKGLKLILAFGGSFLLCLSFLELVPEIYSSENIQIIGFFVLAGFFIQFLLDFLTKGVEHGHAETHEHNHLNPLPIMIGICIHSFLEGMPFAENFKIGDIQNSLLTGIVIHNIPISIVLMSMFVHSGMRKPKALILLLVFALSAPLGAFFSDYLGQSLVENVAVYFDYILAVVVGIFLHISTTIIFETDENHQFHLMKFISVIIGALVFFLLFLI